MQTDMAIRTLTLALVASLAFAGCAPSDAPEAVPDVAVLNNQSAVEERVEAEIASIDSLRIVQAASIQADEEVTGETFERVCKPVGIRAKQLASETGWTVRQAAVKYRNPANEASATEQVLIAQFEADPALRDLWSATPDGDRLYARRINVDASCLACHGAQESQPDFITQKYPDDRAHSFSAGIAPETLEAKVVQDADRLDAIGAIGVARCFATAGAMGSSLFDSDDPFAENRPLDDTRFAVDHFTTKLFKLPEMLNTAAARAEAEGRVDVMRRFLSDLSTEVSV